MRTRLFIDEINNLVAIYVKTGDRTTDYDIDVFLKECGYNVSPEENGVITYLFTKSADPRLMSQMIEWTIKQFDDVLGSDGYDKGETLTQKQTGFGQRKELFAKAKERGLEIKNKTEVELNIPIEGPYKFIRELHPYQKKSVEHILATGNAANFSVPGSGKTSIAYAAISKWLDDGIVKKILVIGPKASFVPWEEEFKDCFGRKPRSLRVSGKSRANDLPDLGPAYDLFLMHYMTAMNHVYEINDFLENNDTVLIIDESHNIKNPKNGRWATDAQKYGINAKRRIILSGTPMPNDAKDLWTQFAFLWPFDPPLGNQMQFNYYIDSKKSIGKYKPDIDPFYERIKKSDLGLPLPKFYNYPVKLRPIQRKIYDLVAAKTLEEINDADIKDQARLQRFRTAKMVRLLQAASNPSMLDEKSTKFLVDSEQFGINQAQLDDRETGENISEIFPTSFDYDMVKNYSTYEIPEKLSKAVSLAQSLMEQKEKVIIWSSFKLNMKIFEEELFEKDQKPILINGDISDDPDDPDNRDKRIKAFKEDTNPRVLIATAASLGESVSLHKHLGKKVCSNAIYLDRNFNGAQFMQSMDRIHRIGMDKKTIVNYHLIVAKKTIDEKIHERLWEKNVDMHAALNSHDLEPLDYEGNVIEPTGPEFEQDYNALVDHLRGKDDLELRDYNDG